MLPLPSSSRTATVADLQRRITALQAPRVDEGVLPTHDAFSHLLPGGSLCRGRSYTVSGSFQLTLGLIARASSAGNWCVFVGFPNVGIEAAAALGVEVEQTVWIPHPGTHHLATLATLLEASPLVVTAPVTVSSAQHERLSARMREQGTTLIATGTWPRSDTTLTVESSQWHGLEDGFGILQSRTVTVRAERQGRVHRDTLCFGPSGMTRVTPTPPALRTVSA